MKSYASLVPALHCYSASEPGRIALSGVSVSIGQPFICIFLISFALPQCLSSTAQIKNAGSITSYKKINGGIEEKQGNTIFDGAKELTQEVPNYQLPIYVKASAIIPVQSLVQSTKEKSSVTLYLHIYNGTEKNSTCIK